MKKDRSRDPVSDYELYSQLFERSGGRRCAWINTKYSFTPRIWYMKFLFLKESYCCPEIAMTGEPTYLLSQFAVDQKLFLRPQNDFQWFENEGSVLNTDVVLSVSQRNPKLGHEICLNRSYFPGTGNREVDIDRVVEVESLQTFDVDTGRPRDRLEASGVVFFVDVSVWALGTWGATEEERIERQDLC
ncbi:hypothetical protein T265_03270 [Opisthorchis viverrini]|uniref:Uncharacterized protein n=1 Tax=Opisthorchis viverrini TaxID=6198 RepID=A0A074ZWP5_OPIVI|nr:hypothetical protein T265_03270 [Opisthorchis viverrini]KER30327.1 hypothetical protein T265_03270 [Opisthorchis viverrini]